MTRPKLLLPDEIHRLRSWAVAAASRGDRDGALVVALLGTAGRRFEVAALRVRDIRMGPGGPEVCFPIVKGGDKNATVPVSKETWTILHSWIETKKLRGESDSPNAPLFASRGGGRMHTATVWRAFRSALARAGVKRRVGVHATRHAAGFLLLRATGDITKVQVFLRHANLSTTSTWYQHVHVPDLRAGIEKAGL